jgi:hypothetical protein
MPRNDTPRRRRAILNGLRLSEQVLIHKPREPLPTRVLLYDDPVDIHKALKAIENQRKF